MNLILLGLSVVVLTFLIHSWRTDEKIHEQTKEINRMLTKIDKADESRKKKKKFIADEIDHYFHTEEQEDYTDNRATWL